MCSSAGHTTCLVRGSPIRTSSDQRSVGSSPRLNAASHVLHRLLVPRHPPCALNNLATQKPHPTDTLRQNRKEAMKRAYKKLSTESEDARVHCAVLNDRPATPTHPRQPTPRHNRSRNRSGWYEDKEAPATETTPNPRVGGGPFPQDPTACLRPDPAASRLRSTHPTPRRNGVRGAVLG